MSSDAAHNTIKHVAIIPDGNRRYAAKSSMPSAWGHTKGAANFRPILRAALNLNIPHITVWGASVSNITKRSPLEVEVLVKLFVSEARALLEDKDVFEKSVRVEFLGRWREFFPQQAIDAFDKLTKETKDHNRHTLTFLIGYSGTDEMLAAVREMTAEQLPADAVTAETLKQHLWTRNLPPVDLVIRTGGEPHWSAGFMMWDVAEAQLHFTPTLWPEFSVEEFKKIIAEHEIKDRRFGK